MNKINIAKEDRVELLRQKYEEEIGKKWWTNPVTHGELGFASWEYQKWLEDKLSSPVEPVVKPANGGQIICWFIDENMVIGGSTGLEHLPAKYIAIFPEREKAESYLAQLNDGKALLIADNFRKFYDVIQAVCEEHESRLSV